MTSSLWDAGIYLAHPATWAKTRGRREGLWRPWHSFCKTSGVGACRSRDTTGPRVLEAVGLLGGDEAAVGCVAMGDGAGPGGGRGSCVLGENGGADQGDGGGAGGGV